MTQKFLDFSREDISLPANRTLAVFLVSVWALFLEMLLIRWIGTEIRIFAYLQNTVLIVCFLGLGIGCMTSREPVALRRSIVVLFILTALMASYETRQYLGNISRYLGVLQDSEEIMWGQTPVDGRLSGALMLCLGTVLTYVLMVLVLEIFVPVGRLLGRMMDEHPDTILAYSSNIAGSLAGTWLFVGLSYFFMPPVAWIAVAASFFPVFMKATGPSWKAGAAIAAVVLCSWLAGTMPSAKEVVWSPYQKLVVYEIGSPRKQDKVYQINVNNTGYQAMLNLSEDFTKSLPEYFDPEMNGYSQYDLPFLLHPDPKRVLLVGAGSGNDAAGALRHNVERITAVEIDPAIISFGRRLHPERPYSSGRVELINDDARSYFATAKERFDVIVFGLLDSHTTTSMTNMRIDNYVYTRESIDRARELLADGGVLVLTFLCTRDYVADRLAGTLRDVFGEVPVAFNIPYGRYGFGGTMFVSGDLDSARGMISANPGLKKTIIKWEAETPVRLGYGTRCASDDWPYLYLEKPGIPRLYYLLAGLMGVLLVRSRKYNGGKSPFTGLGRTQMHFFFLGAAFMLLEVQNISKAAVVLGNTWEVNAVIVSGVLIMILLANLVTYRFRKLPLWAVYILLCAACLGLYFVDLESFAFLPYATKATVVGCLTTLPMLFGGIVFIRSFEATAEKDKALGANLIGAVFGAVLQTVTFLTGIKALLLMVAAFYVIAMLNTPRISRDVAADGA